MGSVLREGWEVRKLGEVYDVRDGTHDSPKYIEKGHPLVTSKNLKNDTLNYDKIKYISEIDYININKRSKVDMGDILFAMIGTIGNPIVIKEKPNFAIKNVALFKVSNNQDSYFLKYYLDSDSVIKKMKKDAKGATQKFVGLNYLRNFEISIPPLQEQEKIVAILDEAFSAIEKAKVNAELNLQNAKELFESYLQGIFENRGEGWEEKILGEMADFRNGINFTKNSKGKEIKIVGVKNFKKHFFVPLENLESVTMDGNLNENDILKNNDILAVRSNGNPKLIGRTILAKNINQPMSHSGFTIRIRLTSSVLSSIYLCHYLKTQKTRDELVKSGNGVGIKSLNQGSLSSLLIPYPPLQEQEKIVKKLNAIQEETKKLEAIYTQKLQDLDELKKSILQKAFNGELT